MPPKKTDPVRSGMQLENKDALKNILKPEEQEKPGKSANKHSDDLDDWNQESKEQQKMLPNLQKVPLITNHIDWKGFVPDKLQLMKNIEAAVDNQVANVVIDLINEYSNLKSLQYKDINKINQELKGG